MSRERIVSAGIAIADARGLPAVSIRNVAARLNASAMALYHYVPSKRDLLNLMLDATYAEFALSSGTTGNWRDALSHFAWESRRCLERHPWVGALRASDPEYGPECIGTLEALLSSLSRFGLDVRTAIRVLGVLFVFVNGFVAAQGEDKGRARSKKRKQSAAQQPAFSRPILATGKFPNVSRFIETSAERPDDRMFERALDWILNGMASDIQSCVSKSDPADARHAKPNSKKLKRL